MRSFFVVASLAMLSVSCTKGVGDTMVHHTDLGTDGASTSDLGSPDAGMCTADPECNDAMDCTIDHCGVGNVCTHTDTCPTGMHCAATGCTMMVAGMCNVDIDCDDHDACDGVETCFHSTHMCVSGRPMNCDDGDACTTDGCAASACTHTVICDSGVLGMDAGPGPFDPATGYNGTFFIAPAPSRGCGGSCGVYTISMMTMSVAGGILSITTDIGTLTQTPVPTGPMFDVTLMDGCGSYSITGTFSDADTFSGTWHAVFGGLCGTDNSTITGVRI